MTTTRKHLADFPTTRLSHYPTVGYSIGFEFGDDGTEEVVASGYRTFEDALAAVPDACQQVMDDWTRCVVVGHTAGGSAATITVVRARMIETY